MTEKQIPINQTQFSFEEPIFEDKAVFVEEKPPQLEDDKPKSKKKLFIILGIVGFILFLVIVILASRKKPELTPTQETTTSPTVTEVGPFQARIDDARDLLDLADPTKQDLSFPPVDMKLRLDPKEK